MSLDPSIGRNADHNQPINHSAAFDFEQLNTAAFEKILERKGAGSPKMMAVFAIKHSARQTLPYGKWVCENGREVVFNREYQPILQRVDGVVSYADRNEMVQGIRDQMMFWDDSCDPTDYLVKHLGFISLGQHDSRRCRQALIRAMMVLKEFTPKEHFSVSRIWSVLER